MIEVLLFILGVHLAMQLIVRLYRIIDLWYRIRDFALGILVSIAGYGILIALLIWALEGKAETALMAGGIFFAIFHLAVFWIGKLLLWHHLKRHLNKDQEAVRE